MIETQNNQTIESKLIFEENQLSDYFSTIFIICWIFIGIVSSIDTVLTVKLQGVMKEMEENPVARFILDADQWDISRFIGIKMFCTILVLGICFAIYSKHKKAAVTVAAGLAAFQAYLLIYLFTF
jgi:hypothetical protein